MDTISAKLIEKGAKGSKLVPRVIMRRIFTLIVLGILIGGCHQRRGSKEIRLYYNRFGEANRELSENNPVDSLYQGYVEFAKAFVIDSLRENPKFFQYNFDVMVVDDQVLSVVELYDKRLEIEEKGPSNDSVYYRLNNIRSLFFDSTGTYLYNLWVSDTEKELLESQQKIEEYFNKK